MASVSLWPATVPRTHERKCSCNRQPVGDANQSGSTPSHSSPHAALSHRRCNWPGCNIHGSRYSALIYTHGGVYSRRFLALNTGKFVSSFWIGEFRAVRHFVSSPRRLLSELWLAATQPHAAQNRTGPILSTRVQVPLCGVALSSHMA